MFKMEETIRTHSEQSQLNQPCMACRFIPEGVRQDMLSNKLVFMFYESIQNFAFEFELILLLTVGIPTACLHFL
jgi:hypothetical protein